MKPNDYSSKKQAVQYHTKRFGGGLKIVSADEMGLIGKWIIEKVHDRPAIYADIGTGTGRVIKEILGHNPKKIFAIDRSQAMLRQLHENFIEGIRSKAIQIMLGEIEHLPLRTGSVSVATGLHLFKHISSIRSALKEVNRVLKPGGYFIFDVLNRYSVVRFHLGSCYALRKTDIISELDASGFKALKIVELHTFGETIYNLPCSDFIHAFDTFIAEKAFGLGTKFLILAQKI